MQTTLVRSNQGSRESFPIKKPAITPIRPLAKPLSIDELNEAEIEYYKTTGLFGALRGLRAKLAKEQKLPAYCVMSDKAMIDIIIKRPLSKEALLQCKGITEKGIEKNGKDILTIMNKYRR